MEGYMGDGDVFDFESVFGILACFFILRFVTLSGCAV